MTEDIFSKAKFLVCPDSFKGTVSAGDVASAIAIGIKRVLKNAEIVIMPLADGGEGTLEILSGLKNFKLHPVSVQDSLGRKKKAHYGILDNSVLVVELAQAASYEKNPNKRKPLNASTYGVGEIIKKALLFHGHKISKIILFVGGSATIDGGAGLIQALGVKFFNRSGHEILNAPGGGDLNNIFSMNLDHALKVLGNRKIEILCDVKNPLLGKEGAARVFAPQKGASVRQVNILEQNLKHFAHLIMKLAKKDGLNLESGGAAGGVPFSMHVLFKAEISSGFNKIAEILSLENAIKSCDFVITGEGKIDHQSQQGKVISGVIETASRYNKPVIAICGKQGQGAFKLLDMGLTTFFTLLPEFVDPSSINPAPDWKNLIENLTERIIRTQIERFFHF